MKSTNLDNVYYRASKNRSGMWMWNLKDSGQRSRGDSTRGCAAQYATAFVRYVNSLTDQNGGRLSWKTSKIHKLNVEGRRSCVKSIRNRRQRRTSRKRSARTRMTKRKTKGGSTVTPTFAALQKAVVATFVSSATWLPRIFSYWSGVDGDRRHVTARRTEYLAHPRTQLARVPDDKSDDLNLMASYSSSLVTTGITVTEEDWRTHSAFMVICFEPDMVDNECCYSRWTGLDCQVIWGKPISYKKTTPFSSYRTSIEESVTERGAELFVDLLNSLFA